MSDDDWIRSFGYEPMRDAPGLTLAGEYASPACQVANASVIGSLCVVMPVTIGTPAGALEYFTSYRP